jgi:uncharacterized protein (TIGR02145 family)
MKMKHNLLAALFASLAINVIAQETLFTPKGTIEDIEGNTYKIIQIGTQIWMQENLRTTRFTNGDPIPTTIPPTLDIRPEENIHPLKGNDYSQPGSPVNPDDFHKMPKYQWAYNGDETTVPLYGRYYTWYAANDPRNVCPAGWKVPTDKDWDILIAYLGDPIAAGGKMKTTGTEHWAEPNKGANNESGFSALPSGARNLDGTFSKMGKYAPFWTTTPALYRHIEHDDPYTFRNYYYSGNVLGIPVRCIKNAPQ